MNGIPVIVVSARGDIQTKLSSFTAGARRYITKPFDSNELISEVERTLKSLERTKTIRDYKDAHDCEGDTGGDFGHLPADLEEKL
jgi:DNA-binding response OmpR family regulator